MNHDDEATRSWAEAHAWWTTVAATLPEGPKRSGWVAMETPVAVACAIIDALRRTQALAAHGVFPFRFTGRQAQVGLLFAAARTLRLSGVSREAFLHVAGTFWDLAADVAFTPDTYKTLGALIQRFEEAATETLTIAGADANPAESVHVLSAWAIDWRVVGRTLHVVFREDMAKANDAAKEGVSVSTATVAKTFGIPMEAAKADHAHTAPPHDDVFVRVLPNVDTAKPFYAKVIGHDEYGIIVASGAGEEYGFNRDGTCHTPATAGGYSLSNESARRIIETFPSTPTPAA